MKNDSATIRVQIEQDENGLFYIQDYYNDQYITGGFRNESEVYDYCEDHNYEPVF